MSDSQVTLRTRKFIRNPLLGRKQMVVCVQPLRQPAKSPTTATERRPERAT
jgi:small subunit ribosomal protein S24e